jgi:hypothetical protein
MKTATFYKRSVSMLMILSIVTSFFVIPTPARAGILGSFLNAMGPLAKIAGKVGGAVVGATLCSAFVPPLGMIAGGLAGWIAGGIITGYGTGSLANLATLGGGIVGAMALGPGAVGLVGGFLLGGFIGRMAMNLLSKADNTFTGGILFKKALSLGSSANTSSTAFSTTTSGSASGLTPTADAGKALAPAELTSTSASDKIQAADAKYQAAYKAYIDATHGSDAKNIESANKNYLSALQEYKALTGKDPTAK